MSVAPTETRQAILHAGNRCDRCSSRAYVLTVLKWSPGLPHAGELMFCRHHYHVVEEAITPYVSILIDERWQLKEHIADDKHVN